MEKLDLINQKLDLILSLIGNNKFFNLQEFCQELGITLYKLKKIYESKQLAIEAPYRCNGHDPIYTLKDVQYMQGVLCKK